MSEESRSYPLVIELMNCSRLPWHLEIVVITTGLLLLLILLVYLDGIITDLLGWKFRREHLNGVVSNTLHPDGAPVRITIAYSGHADL